jgi:hypothetical protein
VGTLLLGVEFGSNWSLAVTWAVLVPLELTLAVMVRVWVVPGAMTPTFHSPVVGS